jgi:hypothetical protein
VQLITNLEPVYAIVLAALLLGEQRQLTPLFYLGVAIILAAVFLQPVLERLRRGPPVPATQAKTPAAESTTAD